jgi:hypothetical protein
VPHLDPWIDRTRDEFCLSPPPDFSLPSLEGAEG